MARNGIQIYSDRLTAAREMRGLTISDLARKVGKTRQHVSMIENGIAMPSPEVLDMISEALNFPARFFTNVDIPIYPLNSAIFFRSMKSALAIQRQQTKRWLQLLVQQYSFYSNDVEFPAVNFYQYEGNYEDLSDYDIEDIAIEVRKAWKLGDGPISNLTLLMENNGIIISHLNMGVEELDACSTIQNGHPFVLINTTKSTCSRILANTAHELGHLVLHNGVDRSELDSKEKHDKLEKQAWRFASSFLMPSSSFFTELHSISLSAFISLKSRWRTSIASMIMRCAEAEVIDDFKKTYLFKEMGRNGYRKKEPLDDTLSIEKPHLLLDADIALVEGEVYTKEQLLYITALDRADYCALIGAEADYMTFENKKPKLYVLKQGE